MTLSNKTLLNCISYDDFRTIAWLPPSFGEPIVNSSLIPGLLGDMVIVTFITIWTTPFYKLTFDIKFYSLNFKIILDSIMCLILGHL